MKKFLVIALALIPLAACGGGSTTPSSGSSTSAPPASSSAPASSAPANTPDSGGEDDDTLTAANWQQVIKANYAFDISVPDGWTFKEGERQTSSSHNVQFTTDAADFTEAYTAFAQHIFDLTAALNPATNNHQGEYPDYTGDKITELPTMMGELMPIWFFDTPQYIVQIDVMGDETTKTVQCYFVAVKGV